MMERKAACVAGIARNWWSVLGKQWYVEVQFSGTVTCTMPGIVATLISQAATHRPYHTLIRPCVDLPTHPSTRPHPSPSIDPSPPVHEPLCLQNISHPLYPPDQSSFLPYKSYSLPYPAPDIVSATSVWLSSICCLIIAHMASTCSEPLYWLLNFQVKGRTSPWDVCSAVKRRSITRAMSIFVSAMVTNLPGLLLEDAWILRMNSCKWQYGERNRAADATGGIGLLRSSCLQYCCRTGTLFLNSSYNVAGLHGPTLTFLEVR